LELGFWDSFLAQTTRMPEASSQPRASLSRRKRMCLVRVRFWFAIGPESGTKLLTVRGDKVVTLTFASWNQPSWFGG
jgi:hypothetical protein